MSSSPVVRPRTNRPDGVLTIPSGLDGRRGSSEAGETSVIAGACMIAGGGTDWGGGTDAGWKVVIGAVASAGGGCEAEIGGGGGCEAEIGGGGCDALSAAG